MWNLSMAAVPADVLHAAFLGVLEQGGHGQAALQTLPYPIAEKSWELL
jgi:hypothetical protein